ncbi:unnamed protein product [Allacma fusca]|uniref:Uncharacterized protein n=1 Tax=Allacma fusca TaxID=39272 RepID=A0A8J2LB21_9HEXA|nr:unnamed protein product [Allacma fusca]
MWNIVLKIFSWFGAEAKLSSLNPSPESCQIDKFKNMDANADSTSSPDSDPAGSTNPASKCPSENRKDKPSVKETTIKNTLPENVNAHIYAKKIAVAGDVHHTVDKEGEKQDVNVLYAGDEVDFQEGSNATLTVLTQEGNAAAAAIVADTVTIGKGSNMRGSVGSTKAAIFQLEMEQKLLELRSRNSQTPQPPAANELTNSQVLKEFL